MWRRILEKLWGFLPDECEVEDCCRKGVRGNENRIYPFKDSDPQIDGMADFYLIMCDYCSSRYHHGEVLNVHGALPRLICHPKGTVVDMQVKRKERKYDSSD